MTIKFIDVRKMLNDKSQLFTLIYGFYVVLLNSLFKYPAFIRFLNYLILVKILQISTGIFSRKIDTNLQWFSKLQTITSRWCNLFKKSLLKFILKQNKSCIISNSSFKYPAINFQFYISFLNNLILFKKFRIKRWKKSFS